MNEKMYDIEIMDDGNWALLDPIKRNIVVQFNNEGYHDQVLDELYKQIKFEMERALEAYHYIGVVTKSIDIGGERIYLNPDFSVKTIGSGVLNMRSQALLNLVISDLEKEGLFGIVPPGPFNRWIKSVNKLASMTNTRNFLMYLLLVWISITAAFLPAMFIKDEGLFISILLLGFILVMMALPGILIKMVAGGIWPFKRP